MSFTNYLENAILTHLFGGSPTLTPLTNVYVALSAADPGEDGASADEPTIGVNGYARINIAVADLTISGNNVSNTNAASFPESTGGWGGSPYPSYTHFALYDASTGGNCLGSAALTTARTVDATGITLTFAIGELDVTLD